MPAFCRGVWTAPTFLSGVRRLNFRSSTFEVVCEELGMMPAVPSERSVLCVNWLLCLLPTGLCCRRGSLWLFLSSS